MASTAKGLRRTRLVHAGLWASLLVTGALTFRVVGSVRPDVRPLEVVVMLASTLLMLGAAFAVTTWESHRKR